MTIVQGVMGRKVEFTFLNQNGFMQLQLTRGQMCISQYVGEYKSIKMTIPWVAKTNKILVPSEIF